jgi:proteic killer suppression protein
LSTIQNFRHEGLKQFFEKGNKPGVQAQHEKSLRLILARLDAAREPRDMSLPGLRLHQMTGNLRGFWSADVSGNWRVIFRIDGPDAYDVDCLDYH